MKRSATHLDRQEDDRKRPRLDLEWDVPTTALLIEEDDESFHETGEPIVEEIVNLEQPKVDQVSEPSIDVSIRENDDAESKANEDAMEDDEIPSSAPFVIVVNSERNFRVIRVYTCLRKAIVEQCVPLTFLARLAVMQIASPVTVFGDRNIGTRIKKAVTNASVSTVARYEDTDRAYVKYVLNKNTKMSNVEVDSVRIVSLKTSDGCAPLCATTATQLGLLASDNRYYGHGVEPLVNNLCGGTGIKFAKEFLRDLLCDPPPRRIAKTIANVCAHLAKTTSALPTLAPKKSAEVYAQVLRATFSNVADVKDVLSIVSTLKEFLSNDQQKELVELLQPVVSHFCSLAGDPDQSVEAFIQALIHFGDKIESVVPSSPSSSQSSSNSNPPTVYSSCANLIDQTYFAAAEKDLFWDQCEETRAIHKEARTLVNSWAESVVEIDNARLVLQVGASGELNLVLVSHDQPIEKTDAIFAGQKRYEHIVMRATMLCAAVRCKVCSELNTQVLQRAWYWLVILQALRSHVKLALQQKWSLPETSDATNVLHVVAMWPYWLKRKDASDYSFQLDGTTVLTGANKSGKSVLLRSACAVALLANCGLMVPCDSARVPRFDKIFLKTSSFDLPHENKSTFTVTTEDLASMSNTVTKKSLVLFDDFGDGTFAQDALFVAAGTLTFLKQKGTASIIATHMRQILDLLPEPQHFAWKTMQTLPNAKRVGESVHSLRDGVCESSMAFSLLCKAGVNREMLDHIALFMNIETERHVEQAMSESATLSVVDSDRGEMVRTIFFHEIYCAESGERDTRDFQSQTFAQKHNCCLVRHTEQAPPCFTNSHFVYLRKNIASDTLYVGETDNIQRRIEEHRKENVGCTFEFHVVSVSNKSIALCAETETIRAFIRRGLRLDSECDGNHRNGM